jgi:AraC family transcriptional regulator
LGKIAKLAAMDTRPIVRQLADGEGWTLNDYVCRSGPGAAAFEERHESVSISSVIAGSFTYASDNGRALLHSGAILLGNAGACYACGHEHSAGDHCLSLQMCPDYFAEIAASVAGSSAFRFKTGMLPAGIDTLSPMSLLEARSQTRDRLMIEEEVVTFAATVIRILSGRPASPMRLSAQDEKRVSRTLRHMEQHCDEALDLDRLAAIATMSKFHFLRVFRRAIGMTPYQFLLRLRLRKAAARLLTSPDPVARIAFESGFGDLSTFTTTFRHRFGLPPQRFRKERRRAT